MLERRNLTKKRFSQQLQKIVSTMATRTYFISVVLLFVLCFLSNVANSQSDNSTCVDTVECSGRGQCLDDTSDSDDICLCDDGYTTHDADEDIECNYQQKEQLTAFLLSFFLGGAGGGRFYLENWTLAALKLSFCIGFPCIICCVMCCCGIGAGLSSDLGGSTSDGFQVAGGFTGCCCMCIYVLGVLAWCLTDIILIGIGDAKDGNGVGMYENL